MGLTKLAAWMKDLGQRHRKTEIVFGIEPTGHYWFPLATFLEDQDIKIVVAPCQQKQGTRRQLADEEWLQGCQGNRGSRSEWKVLRAEFADEGIRDLRILMNLREKVSASLTQVKGRIGNWLDRFFLSTLASSEPGMVKPPHDDERVPITRRDHC